MGIGSRINQMQELVNHLPRRCLGYRTPKVFTNLRPTDTVAPVCCVD